MKCQYARMAILQSKQKDLMEEPSREKYIEATLSKNMEFKHRKIILYYSPRLVVDDLIAGVIEKKISETLTSGPWKNEKHTEDSFKTANFAINLIAGQEVSLEQENGVYTGQAIKVFKSLSEHINKNHSGWHIDFRQISSKKDLKQYLDRHSGAIKRISIVLEKPNADFGITKSLHDDLKDFLSAIKADRLKKDYVSDSATLEPDEKVRKEMDFANCGNGSLKIANKDDKNKTSSFDSNQSGLISQIDDNREIDGIDDAKEIRDVAKNMLNGAHEENSESSN